MVSKLTVRSQVLYMTGLSVSPQWSKAYQHYALPETQLPLTINAIEAKLGMLDFCFPNCSNFAWLRQWSLFVIHIFHVIWVFPRCACHLLPLQGPLFQLGLLFTLLYTYPERSSCPFTFTKLMVPLCHPIGEYINLTYFESVTACALIHTIS